MLASDAANYGLPPWAALLLIVFGGALTALAWPATTRRIDKWKARRTEEHAEEEEDVADHATLLDHERRLVEVERINEEVLTWIRGGIVPFSEPPRREGGISRVLEEILRVVNKRQGEPR